MFVCIIISTISIGFLVMNENKFSIVHQSFFIFLLGIGISTVGFLFLFLQYPFILFDRLIHYGGLLFITGLITFAQVFPSGTNFPKKSWPLYIPLLFLAIVVPFNVIIRNASFTTEGRVVPENGPLFAPYILILSIYFIASVFFIIRTYRRTKGKEHLQLQYLFIGVIVMLLSFFIGNVLLPFLGSTSLYFIGPLSTIVLLVLVLYAIKKHFLLNIRLVLQRGLVYIILFGLIASLYIISLQLFAYVLHRITNTSTILSAGIVMVFGVFFITPLQRYFRKVTDSIFFKDRYDYARALYSLSKTLHTNLTQTEIVTASSELLKEILKTKEVSFRFSNTSPVSVPVSETIAISLPIVFESKTVGLLEVGHKLSGEAYLPTDIQLLETFAYQAAIALEKGRLYEEVEGYNTHLEQLVEERTKELKRLQEDQKQAMIDISHNLQTPLTIIQGELEFFGDNAETEKVQTIKKSLTRVSSFIRQLLHLSKLSHSAYEVDMHPVNLTSLVREQVEYFEVMAREQGVTISLLTSWKVIVLGNKRLLEELLTNLVANAIKYRRTTVESKVIISLVETETNVGIVIEDNGIGIPTEDATEIFSRFYRGSRRSNTSGTGLGLAICKGIVDKHNGTISVTSTLGEKTVFVITLPKMHS